MAGAFRPDQGGAGLALEPGGDAGEDRLDPPPGLAAAAGHDRGTVAGAFLAARDADAEEVDALVGPLLHPAAGVAEIGVAGVDEDVAFAEMAGEHLRLLVDRLARLDHDHDRPRRRPRRGALGARLARRQPSRAAARPPPPPAGGGGGAVVDGDGVALLGHVEREIGAHDAEADQTDIRHSRSSLKLGCSSSLFFLTG